ncbi:MAG: hypothetical protein VX845_00855, partial [Candidatus Thermoplasmatota archaeon]|nr:hypothetical protein [Candidatus Thermoplasmatota archaeon]
MATALPPPKHSVTMPLFASMRHRHLDRQALGRRERREGPSGLADLARDSEPDATEPPAWLP